MVGTPHPALIGAVRTTSLLDHAAMELGTD